MHEQRRDDAVRSDEHHLLDAVGLEPQDGAVDVGLRRNAVGVVGQAERLESRLLGLLEDPVVLRIGPVEDDPDLVTRDEDVPLEEPTEQQGALAVEAHHRGAEEVASVGPVEVVVAGTKGGVDKGNAVLGHASQQRGVDVDDGQHELGVPVVNEGGAVRLAALVTGGRVPVGEDRRDGVTVDAVMGVEVLDDGGDLLAAVAEVDRRAEAARDELVATLDDLETDDDRCVVIR